MTQQEQRLIYIILTMSAVIMARTLTCCYKYQIAVVTLYNVRWNEFLYLKALLQCYDVIGLATERQSGLLETFCSVFQRYSFGIWT